ncbi:LysR family transcriptional regulator [soil metagenome]
MDASRFGLVATRLHYFETVARLGTVRHAAQALNIAPSAISRTIKALEESLGTKLFERIRQRLKLTSAGEILVYHARASAGELDRACAIINDLTGLRRGKVRVSAVESVTRGLLPRVLAEFWQQLPNVSVEVRTVGSQEALRLVAEGETDLGIAFDARPPRGTRQIAAASLRLGALLWPGHPLATRAGVHLHDFAGERVFLSDATLALSSSIEEALLDSLVEFDPRAVTNSIDLMAKCVAGGQGVAFQTRVGVEDELRRQELLFVPLRDAAMKPRKLLLAARASKFPAEPPARLAKLLTAAIESLDGR